MIDGVAENAGFYVTVFVDGESEEGGRDNALQTLLSRLQSYGSIIAHGCMEVESVEAIGVREVPGAQPGVAWYREPT